MEWWGILAPEMQVGIVVAAIGLTIGGLMAFVMSRFVNANWRRHSRPQQPVRIPRMTSEFVEHLKDQHQQYKKANASTDPFASLEGSDEAHPSDVHKTSKDMTLLQKIHNKFDRGQINLEEYNSILQHYDLQQKKIDELEEVANEKEKSLVQVIRQASISGDSDVLQKAAQSLILLSESKAAETIAIIARDYFIHGEYRKALSKMEKASSLAPNNLGYRNHLVAYHLMLKQDTEALHIAGKVEDIAIPKVGQERETAESYLQLGATYYAQDNYEKAIEFYNKSLTIYHNTGQESSKETADIYRRLATVYRHKKLFDKAIDCYHKSIDITKVVTGEKDIALTVLYNGLGQLYRAQGKNAEAIECYEKNIAIHGQCLHKAHPVVAMDYSLLALAHYDSGNYAKSITYYDKSIAIRLVNTDPANALENIMLAKNYYNLGLAYNALTDHDHALKYYDKAEKLLIGAAGQDHPELPSIYGSIGTLYSAKKNYVKATGYFEKSLARFGEDHPKIDVVYNNLGSAYRLQNDYVKAMNYYEKALEVAVKKFGYHHPQTKAIHKNIDSVRALAKGGGQALR